MQIKETHYNEDFRKEFQKLPKQIQQKACKTEILFIENLFHPSLRLNKLKGKLDGLWSISIDMKYRIVFKPLENGVIIFISIGAHAIYNL